MKIKMEEKYGKKIFNQDSGFALGSDIYKNYIDNSEKTILNFIGVDSINTAFWNALLSSILNFDKNIDPKNLFGVVNANQTILSTLAISVELYKYLEDDDN